MEITREVLQAHAAELARVRAQLESAHSTVLNNLAANEGARQMVQQLMQSLDEAPAVDLASLLPPGAEIVGVE